MFGEILIKKIFFFVMLHHLIKMADKIMIIL